MGFSSKTDVFGFLGFRLWDAYIGLLGISMWINLWCGLGGFRRVCSDDIVMGKVGLLGLDWQQVGLLGLAGISC